MTINIQPFIDQRPHLKDPLEFYARWQQFHEQIIDLLGKRGSAPGDSRAYPPGSAEPVVRAFSSIFGLSHDGLAPLARGLADGAIDFMRLPLDEPPDLSLALDGEPNALFFLLSRSFFLVLRESCLLDGREWQGGRCPLCSARPALSSIVEGPRRRLHCSWCGTTGSYRFIGCPNCGENDSTKLGTLVPEGERGYRVATCDTCHTYVKVVEGGVLGEMTVDLADMASLPLDIVAQEKGYARLAPNPIGMRKIS